VQEGQGTPIKSGAGTPEAKADQGVQSQPQLRAHCTAPAHVTATK